MKRATKSNFRKVPQNALFRCSCGGWVICDRNVSSYGHGRVDSCDSCNRVQ